MHMSYRSIPMQQLRDQQVRFAPRVKKLEQIRNAERLLFELDAERQYPYEYLYFRITGFRLDAPGDVLSGAEALHDVRRFVEDLSDSANVSVDEVGEPVYTVQELSDLFNVSNKTISRWREQGLASRRFVFCARKRVGFLRSSVDRFCQQNQKRVERGQKFSQLTDHERGEIIRRARRLARGRCVPLRGDAAYLAAHGTERRDDPLHVAAFRRTASGAGHLRTATRSVARRDEAEDLSDVPPRRLGGTAGEAILPYGVQHLADCGRDAGGPDYGVAAGLHLHASFDQPEMAAESWVRHPTPIPPRRDEVAHSSVTCHPTWPACMTCPCSRKEQEQHLFRKLNYLKYRPRGCARNSTP